MINILKRNNLLMSSKPDIKINEIVKIKYLGLETFIKKKPICNSIIIDQKTYSSYNNSLIVNEELKNKKDELVKVINKLIKDNNKYLKSILPDTDKKDNKDIETIRNNINIIKQLNQSINDYNIYYFKNTILNNYLTSTSINSNVDISSIYNTVYQYLIEINKIKKKIDKRIIKRKSTLVKEESLTKYEEKILSFDDLYNDLLEKAKELDIILSTDLGNDNIFDKLHDSIQSLLVNTTYLKKFNSKNILVLFNSNTYLLILVIKKLVDSKYYNTEIVTKFKKYYTKQLSKDKTELLKTIKADITNIFTIQHNYELKYKNYHNKDTKKISKDLNYIREELIVKERN